MNWIQFWKSIISYMISLRFATLRTLFYSTDHWPSAWYLIEWMCMCILALARSTSVSIMSERAHSSCECSEKKEPTSVNERKESKLTLLKSADLLKLRRQCKEQRIISRLLWVKSILIFSLKLFSARLSDLFRNRMSYCIELNVPY